MDSEESETAGLTVEDFFDKMRCQVCTKLVEMPVECAPCGNFFCKQHLSEPALTKCPFCRSAPLDVKPLRAVRRIIDDLPIICKFCKKRYTRGAIEVHTNHCPHNPALISPRRVRNIPRTALKRSIENYFRFRGLCGGTSSHELFVADYWNDVLRVLDVSADRLKACDVYQSAAEGYRVRVHDVAYSGAELFVAILCTDRWGVGVSVRSFSRTNGDWSFCRRMQLAAEGTGRICLRVLRDGSLFCGQWDTDGVHACRVQASRSMQHCARVALLTAHMGFDVQLVGSEKRLAAAFQDGSVALFRVNKESAEQLSSFQFPDTAGVQMPLFCGDTVFFGIGSNGCVQEAVSFSTADGLMQRDRHVIPRNNSLDISCWCYVNGMLYAWDGNSKDLLIYSFDLEARLQ